MWKSTGWCSLLLCTLLAVSVAGFHFTMCTPQGTDTLFMDAGNCLGQEMPWKQPMVCVYPFKQELNISASRRPFPFCLWFWLWRYSYRNGISAAGFLKASKCAVGWRYCLIYSRLTLTLPQFYTVLLHFAVRDAKPLVWLSCCTNLKLLN